MPDDLSGSKKINILHGMLKKEVDDIASCIEQSRNSLGETPYPPMDVFLKRSNLHIMIELPGLTTDDFTVYQYGEHIVIEGLRRPECKEKYIRYLRTERDRLAFKRVVHVPFLIEPKNVRASFRYGVLDVVIEQVVEVQ